MQRKTFLVSIITFRGFFFLHSSPFIFNWFLYHLPWPLASFEMYNYIKGKKKRTRFWKKKYSSFASIAFNRFHSHSISAIKSIQFSLIHVFFFTSSISLLFFFSLCLFLMRLIKLPWKLECVEIYGILQFLSQPSIIWLPNFSKQRNEVDKRLGFSCSFSCSFSFFFLSSL